MLESEAKQTGASKSKNARTTCRESAGRGNCQGCSKR